MLHNANFEWTNPLRAISKYNESSLTATSDFTQYNGAT
ncbi:hypothetical protein ROA7450_03091 [Roseovarius albus]|uniref:Uncharacterized protein n=1 Tax=Roseovarius albus TaxID=1247867 RepID=A0A1X6ZU51_9RHOB|nr:hypothetical protein ROA7450_03091 [Roseovarius albus]